MKKKHKLLNYSAMASVAIAASNTTEAQIVYTDVNPDQTFSFVSGNQVYNLDMDNDFTIDYEISLMSFVGNMFVATPQLVANDVGLVYMSGTDYLRAFTINQTIDANQSFGGNSSTGLIGGIYNNAYGLPITIGSFPGQNDRYIGVRFDISGQPHYGWARVDVAADVSSFTIKDYAYEATPNTGIMAGSTVSNVLSNELENVKIKTFPNNRIMISVLDEVTNGELVVAKVTGQIVKTVSLNQGTNLFSFDDLSTGLYVVSAKFSDGTITRKVMVN